MKPRAYYNEFDPFAAAWLRELIKKGLIADGDVDERSIEDVVPAELSGYTQCHFFAGIGVWSYALRRAGWSDDRRAWTGSCPCQPFSAAGKGDGFADERHLWPAFHWLIQQCRPAVVFGEQVASKAVEPWVDLVQADLETLGYAFGCVPFPSAGVGAPHIRDRLFWVADATGKRIHGVGGNAECPSGQQLRSKQKRIEYDGSGDPGRLADAPGPGSQGSGPRGDSRQGRQGTAAERGGEDGGLEHSESDGRHQRGTEPDRGSVATGCGAGGMADAGSERRQQDPRSTLADEAADGGEGRDRQQQDCDHIASGYGEVCRDEPASPTHGFWGAADWLFCRDGKWRPVEPGTFPLAHGSTARVGRLRGYGNAINTEAARLFIEAYLEKEALLPLSFI